MMLDFVWIRLLRVLSLEPIAAVDQELAVSSIVTLALHMPLRLDLTTTFCGC